MQVHVNILTFIKKKKKKREVDDIFPNSKEISVVVLIRRKFSIYLNCPYISAI